MEKKRKTYYEILGVAEDADESAIRKGYRRAIRENHPDLNQGNRRNEVRTRQINEALTVLTDPEKRAQYDGKLERKRERDRQRRQKRSTSPTSSGTMYSASRDEIVDPVEVWPDEQGSANSSQYSEDVEYQLEPEAEPNRRKQSRRAKAKPVESVSGFRWTQATSVRIVVGAMAASLFCLIGVWAATNFLNWDGAQSIAGWHPGEVDQNKNGNHEDESGDGNSVVRKESSSAGNSNRSAGGIGNSGMVVIPKFNPRIGSSETIQSDRVNPSDSGASSSNNRSSMGVDSAADSDAGISAEPVIANEQKIRISAEELAQANDLINVLLRERLEDYASNSPGEEKRKLKELAERLVIDTYLVDSEIEKYALLIKACEFAVASGNPDTFNEITEKLDEKFVFEDLELRVRAVEKWHEELTLTELPGEPSLRHLLAKLTISLADYAIQDSDQERGVELYRYAIQILPEGASLRELLSARIGQLKTGDVGWLRFEDGTRNLCKRWWEVLGEHWCYEFRKWEAGAKFLSKGDDPLLKLIGETERSYPSSRDEQVELGDLWWKLSERDELLELLRKGRAGYWYKRAVVENDAGSNEISRRLHAVKRMMQPPIATNVFDYEKAQLHQIAWANYLGQPPQIKNSFGMYFNVIPAGKFVTADGDEFEVKIPFYISTTEVTQQNFNRIMDRDATGFFSRAGDGGVVAAGTADELPVEMISYEDAKLFCQKLSEATLEESKSRIYRLPTEAEWEFACRAGSTGLFAQTKKAREFGQVAWYKINSKNRTHPVAMKKPNPFGLYDMHGNVCEFCLNDRGNVGPVNAGEVPWRGGSYISVRDRCDSGFRGSVTRAMKSPSLGFRVVLIAEPWAEALAGFRTN